MKREHLDLDSVETDVDEKVEDKVMFLVFCIVFSEDYVVLPLLSSFWFSKNILSQLSSIDITLYNVIYIFPSFAIRYILTIDIFR